MIYRLHFTCPAKHKTYTDYKTMRSAKRNMQKHNDITSWYATHIELIIDEHWERINGAWERIQNHPNNPIRKSTFIIE